MPLKRPGGPLDAKMNAPDASCDLACVLILAGGVHRSLPAGAKVILSGMSIHNRLAPNVSRDEREGASARFGELFRIYLRDMGVETELLDIVDGIPKPGARPSCRQPSGSGCGSSRRCRCKRALKQPRSKAAPI